MKSYYIDSCIWLNLFQKEGDSRKGKPYWLIAEDFIKSVIVSENSQIACSSAILREIQSKLDSKSYACQRKWMNSDAKIMLLKINSSDVEFAHKLESELNYDISYYDCLHIAICMRLGLVLITRDKKLLKIASKYVPALKPEELIN